MNVIVDLIGHFGHLGACRDALTPDQQLRAIDVDHLEDQGELPPKKPWTMEPTRGLSEWSGHIARFRIRSAPPARLQHAEMIAFDSQERT